MTRDARDDLAAGIAAGATCTIVGHPFDTVKVLMQRRASGGAALSALGTSRELYARRGVRGFYAGVAAPMIGASTETAFNYVAYHRARAYALGGESSGASSATQRALASAFAGAFAGAAMSVILTPFELVKCRTQVGFGNGSVMRCASDVVRAHGVLGLFRGFSHTTIREVACGAAYFCAWDVTQSLVPRARLGTFDSASVALDAPREALAFEAMAAVACGGASGVVAWSAALPLDNAKTLFQCSNPGDAHDLPPMKLLAHIYRTKGIAGLYAGARPILARAFPANAAQWLAFEAASRALRDRRQRAVADDHRIDA